MVEGGGTFESQNVKGGGEEREDRGKLISKFWEGRGGNEDRSAEEEHSQLTVVLNNGGENHCSRRSKTSQKHVQILEVIHPEKLGVWNREWEQSGRRCS